MAWVTSSPKLSWVGVGVGSPGIARTMAASDELRKEWPFSVRTSYAETVPSGEAAEVLAMRWWPRFAARNRWVSVTG